MAGVSDTRSRYLFSSPASVCFQKVYIRSSISQEKRSIRHLRVEPPQNQLKPFLDPTKSLLATMAANGKDPITCHVLDTLTGRPAPHMQVHLQCLNHNLANKTKPFSCVTDADGRITRWQSSTGDDSVQSVLETLGTTSIWKLSFETGKYYGTDNTFWPQVDLTFSVKSGEHYHVPLLLGPYSYTTYRGS